MAKTHEKSASNEFGLGDLCKTVIIPLPRAPVPMARRLVQIVNAIFLETVAGDDVGVLEFAVLSFLRREPDLDQIRLATRIGVDRTNIGVIVDNMEMRGLIERRVNPDDRRARLLRLTKAGLDLHARLQPKTAVARDRIFAPLTHAEREVFYDLMERVIAANERYCEPGMPRRKRSI